MNQPEPPPPPPPAGPPAHPYAYPLPAGAYQQLRPIGPAPGLMYAGFWIRFGAYVIDTIIVDGPIYAVIFGLFHDQLFTLTCGYQTVPLGTSYLCTGGFTGLFWLATLGVQLVHALYFIAFWMSGATIGQRLLRLRVVDVRNGARISLGKAALRFAGYLVSGIFFNLGFMWAGWDPEKQGWHDKIAGTFVVRPLAA